MRNGIPETDVDEEPFNTFRKVLFRRASSHAKSLYHEMLMRDIEKTLEEFGIDGDKEEKNV